MNTPKTHENVDHQNGRALIQVVEVQENILVAKDSIRLPENFKAEKSDQFGLIKPISSNIVQETSGVEWRRLSS